MNKISELFEGKDSSLYKTFDKVKTSERAELLRFFVENLKDKEGKTFKPARVAMALAHLEEKDLYFMISEFKDIEKRSGFESASKHFWWSIKNK